MQIPLFILTRPRLETPRIACHRREPFLPDPPERVLRRVHSKQRGWTDNRQILALLDRQLAVRLHPAPADEEDVAGTEGNVLTLCYFFECMDRNRRVSEV